MNINERALNKCHPELRKLLDPMTIIPYLSASGLLTANDIDSIQLPIKTRHQKIDEIKSKLPTKGKEWWDKFMSCLKQSSHDHIAHGELLQSLEEALNELKGI